MQNSSRSGPCLLLYLRLANSLSPSGTLPPGNRWLLAFPGTQHRVPGLCDFTLVFSPPSSLLLPLNPPLNDSHSQVLIPELNSGATCSRKLPPPPTHRPVRLSVVSEPPCPSHLSRFPRHILAMFPRDCRLSENRDCPHTQRTFYNNE